MKFKLKIWHLLFFLWVLLLITRGGYLLNIYMLLYRWFILFLDNTKTAFAQLNFDLVDVFISGFLFIILPFLFFLLNKKLKFLYAGLSFASVVLIFLTIAFLFAPLVASTNPDFYKNIGVTRLLPPLTSVKVLHFKTNKIPPVSSLEKFLSLKKEVVKNPFDNSIEYIDSISDNKEITYYQNEVPKKPDKNSLVIVEDNPYVTTRLFLLGSDQFGRDVLTRLIYGARISLLVGFGSVLISLFIGLTFGFLAGYKGGIFNLIFSRITDMFLSFPVIFLVVLILALFGNSLFAVIAVLGFAGWMSLFKIVKTEVLSIKNKNYFISAVLLGLNKSRLLFREVLPVIIVPVVVNLIFQFGNIIIAESALSYLGLGLGDNYPSWGSMIQSGQEYLSSAWWMIFSPGITLIITLLSANSFGISLNRKLNPRLQND